MMTIGVLLWALGLSVWWAYPYVQTHAFVLQGRGGHRLAPTAAGGVLSWRLSAYRRTADRHNNNIPSSASKPHISGMNSRRANTARRNRDVTAPLQPQYRPGTARKRNNNNYPASDDDDDDDDVTNEARKNLMSRSTSKYSRESGVTVKKHKFEGDNGDTGRARQSMRPRDPWKVVLNNPKFSNTKHGGSGSSIWNRLRAHTQPLVTSPGVQTDSAVDSDGEIGAVVPGAMPTRYEGPDVDTIINNMPDVIKIRRLLRTLTSGTKDIAFPVNMGPISGWRTHAKLAVQPAHTHQAGVKIGLYRPNTHTVERTCDDRNCPEHHPVINVGVRLVARACKQAGITGFVRTHASTHSTASSLSQLRYVQLSLQRHTNKLQLTLVLNAKREDYKKHAPAIIRFLKALYAHSESEAATDNANTSTDKGGLWHSVYINFNDKLNSNAIFNYDSKDAWLQMRGEEYLPEKIGAVSMYLPPQAFRQAMTSILVFALLLLN
jgi:hypothetical protein